MYAMALHPKGHNTFQLWLNKQIDGFDALGRD
jgi:hypothetical protein